MGKTPGKWIKTLLTKKSSKSSSLKKKEILKPADKGEAFISSNEPVLEIPVERPRVSAPISDIGSRNEIDSEKEIVALLPNPEASLLSAREDGDDVQTTINLDSLDDSQKTRHEQAATLAQAAFRGYLARRAFRTLKGIIKLQALVRGHLVRRQAVATLTCVWGIVKLQALARGQKVRRSDIGIEAQKIYSQGKVVDSKYATSSGVGFSARAEMMRKNSYIQKLLATSPTAMPLHLQYSPGEANSAEEWLDRWTRSQFWVPLPQPKKNQEDPKTQTKHRGLKTKENDQSRLKRSMRKPSNANVENGSSRSAESEKRKRNIIRKISSHSTDPIQEHSPTEKDKVKRNVRKSADSTKDVSNRSEVGSEKTKVSLRKSSGSPAPDLTVTDQGNGTTDSVENVTTDSVENVTDVVVTSEQPDLETSLNLPAADGLVDELHDHSAVDGRPAESNGKTECTQGTDKELNSNDARIKKENQKSSQRRTSLPANIDDQDNGLHSTPKLPSYMAPTESAKARLRGQGSPRVSQEGIEKNGITRRLSLPSSTNGKFSTPSPRAQRLIQVTGKGAARSDRSLSASRDAGTKNT